MHIVQTRVVESPTDFTTVMHRTAGDYAWKFTKDTDGFPCAICRVKGIFPGRDFDGTFQFVVSRLELLAFVSYYVDIEVLSLRGQWLPLIHNGMCQWYGQLKELCPLCSDKPEPSSECFFCYGTGESALYSAMLQAEQMYVDWRLAEEWRLEFFPDEEEKK